MITLFFLSWGFESGKTNNGGLKGERNNKIKRELTHDTDLIDRPVFLSRLHPGYKIPQADGAQGDEAKVDSIQEWPGRLHGAEHSSRSHKEAQDDPEQQQDEVHDGRGSLIQARSVQDAHRRHHQRVHELLHAHGQHQHGEGHADQRVEDGEGLASVGERSGVAITWRATRRTRWGLRITRITSFKMTICGLF